MIDRLQGTPEAKRICELLRANGYHIPVRALTEEETVEARKKYYGTMMKRLDGELESL